MGTVKRTSVVRDGNVVGGCCGCSDGRGCELTTTARTVYGAVLNVLDCSVEMKMYITDRKERVSYTFCEDDVAWNVNLEGWYGKVIMLAGTDGTNIILHNSNLR